MNATKLFFIAIFAYFSAAAPMWAQERPAEGEAAEEFPEAPLPPDLPDPIKSGEAIEPEVLIIKTDKAVIEEYRVNGKHYMSKITPSVGKPYYLVDRDGDGLMEARMSEIYDDFVVPQWVIFSW